MCIYSPSYTLSAPGSDIPLLSHLGKPTDPELREELKEEIKQEPNKSGGGEGQWAAWKVGS